MKADIYIPIQGFQIQDSRTYNISKFNWLGILREQELISTISDEVIYQEKIQELNTVRLHSPNIYSIITLLNDILIKHKERDTEILKKDFTVSKKQKFMWIINYWLFLEKKSKQKVKNLKQNLDLKIIIYQNRLLNLRNNYLKFSMCSTIVSWMYVDLLIYLCRIHGHWSFGIQIFIRGVGWTSSECVETGQGNCSKVNKTKNNCVANSEKSIAGKSGRNKNFVDYVQCFSKVFVS